MFFDPHSIGATIVCLVLSAFVTAAYTMRIWYRMDVRYDVYSEWLGHGLHGIGMMFASAVMLGWVPAFVPFPLVAAIFAFCTVVFVARLVFRLYYIWWWDVLHVVGSASMTYMFIDHRLWLPEATIFFIGYYLLVIVIYIHYVIQHAKTTAPRTRLAQQLSNAGHHAMAVVMIVMLFIMQWPEVTARLSGIICGDAPRQVLPRQHDHHPGH